MQLFKFCKTSHNINRGAQLQIGNLYGYRNIENSELRDEHEGKYEFTIEFPEEISLDRRWCNLLLQGFIGFGGDDTPRFPGGFSAQAEKIHIVKSFGDHVILKDTVIRIKREVSNCFIFCMSLLRDASEKPFDGYDDHWSVSMHGANDFAQRVGELIFKQAKLNQFDEVLMASNSLASVQRLNLQVAHKNVIYRDRHISITNENRPSYEELFDLFLNVAFVKPKSFEREKEYRFVYELNDGSRIYSPKDERLLLTLNPLANL